MEIINGFDLASYPGVSGTDTELDNLATLANDEVTDAWANPENPIPGWVTRIALRAAARGSWNPKGLQSWTRTLDDASRTERMPDGAVVGGVYLKDSERALLSGLVPSSGVGTIRVTTPGQCRDIRY